MTMLKQLLSELEDYLDSKRVPILQILQHGLLPDDINKILIVSTISSESLVQLYSWQNGMSDTAMEKKTIEELELFPNGIMLSLEDALNRYRIYTKEQNIWSRKYFPIFTDGGGEYTILDIDNKSPTMGTIFLYAPSLLLSEEPETIYDSIESFFRTVLNCYKMEAYYFNPVDDTIEVDYDKRQKIAFENNPKSKYWK